MPIYEYRCKNCGEESEVLQKISDRPLRKCKSCGGGLERLMSNNAFHLKGSGWYKTDYASSGKGKDDDSTKTKKEETAKKSGEKTKKGAEKSKKAKEKSGAST